MSRFDSPLNNLRVASPCSASWDQMQGDERKRFCGECKLNVYNLSGMTRYDAEHLLRMSEGRLCVRYFTRQDGTVLTKDCPVGWALVKKRVSVFAAAAFSLLLSLLGSVAIVSLFKKALPDERPLMGAVAITRPTPTPEPTPKNEFREIMGDIASPKVEPAKKKSPKPKVRRVLPVFPSA